MWPMLNCGLRSVPNLFWGNTNLIDISSSQMFSELKKQTLPQDLIDRDKYLNIFSMFNNNIFPKWWTPPPPFLLGKFQTRTNI